MKTLFTLCFFSISLSLSGQTYPYPDFVEKPMYYNLSTHELQAIERQVKPFRQEASGYNQTSFYKEPQSSFRIKKSDGVQFIIKLVNTLEPDLILFLYSLSVNNGNRVIKLRLSVKDQNQGLIPFQYRKVGENIYMLTVENIAVGEYVWYLKSASYLFSVE